MAEIDKDDWQRRLARERIASRRLGRLLGTLNSSLPDSDDKSYKGMLLAWFERFPEKAKAILDEVLSIPSEYVLDVDNSDALK